MADSMGANLTFGSALIRALALGRALGDVTTLRDPDVMKELEAKIAEESDDESDDASAQRSPALAPVSANAAKG